MADCSGFRDFYKQFGAICQLTEQKFQLPLWTSSNPLLLRYWKMSLACKKSHRKIINREGFKVTMKKDPNILWASYAYSLCCLALFTLC
jgi:hypothetical protein